MLRRHSHVFQSFALAFDVVAITACWFAAYAIRFPLWPLHISKVGSPGLMVFVELLPVVLAAHAFAFILLGLYAEKQDRSWLSYHGRIIQAAVLGWLTMVAVLYYAHGEPYSRIMLFLFLILTPVALSLSRSAVRGVMLVLRRRGVAVERAAVVGTGRLARRVVHRLAGPRHGIRVCYLIAETEDCPQKEVLGVPVQGAISNLVECVKEDFVDTVLVALSSEQANKLEDVLNELGKLPVKVAFIPDFTGVLTVDMGVSEVEGFPLIRLYGRPVEGWNGVGKRAIDIAGSLALLALFGIPMLALAALVKLTSAGPVFYRQERMSLGGRPFMLLKFRSMYVGAEEAGPTRALKGDPRRTWVGAIMRRTSLDELPQLINTLRGEMSLVGPRPERPCFIYQLADSLPAYMLRHNVKAGITGWAQINGYRGNTSFSKRLEFDLYYINNWSLAFDILIIVLTPFWGLVNRNAY